MKETNEKVYRCDFCNKAMINKGFMKLHERQCKQNPKNKHKCFEYCVYLRKDINEYEEDRQVSFYCINKESYFYDKDLYSYKLERFKCNQKRIKNLIRMPLECNHFKSDIQRDEEEMSKIKDNFNIF